NSAAAPGKSEAAPAAAQTTEAASGSATGPGTEVVMPQMGESIFEGTITKWLKQVGDTVQRDEPLFEISTDKVDAEIPSPVAGVLTEIRIHEGATVTVNTVVAVVSESAEATPGQPAPAAKPQQTQAGIKPPAAPQPSSGVEVVMPQMGESIFEGTITRWLKKVGDRVEKDEPLFEISTDKVDAEIPAPVAGVLTAIRTPEGQTVTVNTVVAVLGGAASASAEAAAAAASGQPVSPAPAQAQAQSAAAAAVEGGRIRSSPLVRRIAREHHIDLAQIRGTGSEGRVTKEDILRYIEAGNATAATGARVSGPAVPPQAPLSGEVVPLSRMRAIIAERMVESKRISPHVHTVYKIDMTRVVRARDRAKDIFEQRHGVKLTFLPFVAAAVIAAVRRHPIVNASLIDNAVHYHANVNLGIAVALEWGLIVPVVRHAEQRSFADLGRAIADLAGRARAKKLNPDEVGGSTFTLTNAGVFGDEFSTPIINQPDSAILCISGLKKEPVVLTDAEGNDTIAIRSMQHFTLGFDHRLIDGADACRFMLEFKRVLENWDREIV
ncbi:MAG TPA: 2-oxo acid dehydrogenase subunit E2, partial [Terracidiphilus sp.]|nr:2-oxo acid dehydrogenase subunit E2 [Terracidiphilus sp.]